MATIAMLLPLTYNVPPVAALIMLAGIYYGAMYGCSTTSILVNLPGETASVVTCIDGYQMARKRRAGAVPRDRSPRLVFCRYRGHRAGRPGRAADCRNGLEVRVSGILLADADGTDRRSGARRGQSGQIAVDGGARPAARMCRHRRRFQCQAVFASTRSNWPTGSGSRSSQSGIFAVGEIIMYSERTGGAARTVSPRSGSLLPDTRGAEAVHSLRSFSGTATRIILRASCREPEPSLRPSVSYMVEKKHRQRPVAFRAWRHRGLWRDRKLPITRTPSAIFIPMLTLGIPASGTMALMLGALMIQGITPGPTMQCAQARISLNSCAPGGR